MTSIAVAETETACTQVLPEADQRTIDVNVGFDNDISLSQTFIRVPQYGSLEITWLLRQDSGDPRTIVFDNPPIRILSSPDQTQPVFYAVREPENRSVTFTWDNVEPDLFGTSFAYRVHAVICNGDGTFTPLASDPIIRNDPPPAP